MNAKKKNTGTIALRGISPWLIIGAMFVLAPIFVFMTFDNVRKQREQTIQVFTEKGDTLIRAFEAGVRSGRMEQQQDVFQLQKLLMETAQQPGIDFITVTDTKGKIIADSDPYLIGENYGDELDLERLSQSPKIAWRLAPNPDGVDTFEVFRRFAPSRRHDDSPPEGKVQAGRDDLNPRLVVFIGLNVGPIEAARKDATRHTILMAALLLFIGLSGVVSLFFAQGYRSARSSLSRIKVFTDSLVEHMPIGLVALDNGGMIISFNQSAESILRLPVRKVIGSQDHNILPWPLQEIIRALGGGKGIIAKEIDCPLAEGKTIPLEVIAAKLVEENGAFMGSVILFRDLTEVRHLKKEIARSQRLASLVNLAAGVAHEIRNPLSSIKGFATYFKERYRDNPVDGETADIMVQEVERLNRVITQLLDFARPLTVDKQPTPLSPLIRQTLKMIAGQAEAKNIAIRADMTDIPEVMIDADKIKQVFFNLFLNALEMMPPGGILQVKVRPVEEDAAVNITISDSGP
ncbi:MAG: histidine kinase dimerization/phospho-acceptor domain-containing protein, partial [Deltaproteobacteria bacterium]|nr:histidine kinase dimerization/phospho-acceptor domain-containing protein [Deltaproteobacteria bacterium]